MSTDPYTEPLPSWRPLVRRTVRALAWIALALGVAAGLYLTLRPSGYLRSVPWLPHELARWADYNGRIRNIPAFAALAVPFMILANGRRARRRAVLALGVFAALTECAQRFIPGRWFEWQDIACAWAGLLLTWGLFEAGFRLAWWIRECWRGAEQTPVNDAQRDRAYQPALARVSSKPPQR